MTPHCRILLTLRHDGYPKKLSEEAVFDLDRFRAGGCQIDIATVFGTALFILAPATSRLLSILSGTRR